MKNRLWVLLVVTACSEAGTDQTVARTAPVTPVYASPAAAAIALGMSPMSVDDRGIPRLMTASETVPHLPGANADAIAIAHVTRLASAWGASVPELVPLGDVAVPGGTIVRLQQQLATIAIDRSELRVFIRDDGSLHAVSGSMISSDLAHAVVFVDETEATARAVSANYHAAFDPKALTVTRKHFRTGTSGAVHVELSNATRVWALDNGGLVPAWAIDTYASNGKTSGDAFHTVVSGDRVLEQHSIVASDAFNYRVFANPTGELHPFDGPIVDPSPVTGGVTTPYPAFVAPNLVSVAGLDHLNDPWLPSGATVSTGNNVDAYTDFTAPDGFSPGDFRADVTSASTFDRTYDLAAAPLSTTDQQKAGIIALFYTTNWLHDFWYDNGFIEAVGNAQTDNYGRGGVAGDPLLAEAQDDALAGTLNNANMATPADGMSPKLQVYLWSGATTAQVTVSNRTPLTGTASFGPANFTITGTVVLANDGTGTVTDACETLTNNVNGKVVLVDRGTCAYKQKAANVQAAGGIAMLLADNSATDTAPPTMGDSTAVTTVITIGSLDVLLADGTQIKTDLMNGAVTATLARTTGVEHDGDLDASVLAHEYGHYLHHRLSDCGAQLCGAMSEGWGDFDALMFILRDGDNLDGAYPLAVYSTVADFESAYFGIRRAPYSVDQTINALSFRHMTAGAALPTTTPFLPFGQNNEVHNAGEVWAVTMWEAYVALQKELASYTAARAQMAKYVVASMLMTPVDTTPTEARDALLIAANATDAPLFAHAFARRGMGACAVSPDRESTDFSGIVESSDVKGRFFVPAVTSSDSITTCDEDGILDGGEAGRIYIPLANNGEAALTNVSLTVTTTTPGVTITSSPVTLATFGIGQTLFATADVTVDKTVNVPTAGDFAIAITADDACAAVMQPVAIRLNVDDVANSSTTDTFDAGNSVWTASSPNWAHVRATAIDGQWHGDDQSSPSSVTLTSPGLVADPTSTVKITFTHTYDFESTFDGGVIEYSIDGGTTWVDVSTATTPGYTDTIGTTSGNVLGGRMAFTGKNPSFPAPDTVSLDFGQVLTGHVFFLRFHIGTDEAAGATGWTIDNVAISGIVNTPFPSQVTNQHTCVGSTSPDAGTGGPLPGDDVLGGCCDAGPLRTGNVLIAFGVLALYRRRRR